MINSATHAWWITYVILILLLAPSHLCAVVETVKWDLNTMEPDLLENRTFHFVVAHVLRFHRLSHAERALHEIKTVGTQLHVLESELHMTQWRGVLSRDTKGGLAEMILGLTNWHLPVLAWLGPYCSDYACYLAMAEARFRNHELSDAWHDVNAYSIQQLGYRHIGDLLRLKEANENISEFVHRTHAIDIWEDSNIRKQKLRALLRDNELIHRRLNNPHDYM